MWGAKYPTIVKQWRLKWKDIITLFDFPPAIRKAIYTTNAIESLNMQRRNIIETRGHFPNDEAAIKLMWLALRNITAILREADVVLRRSRQQVAGRTRGVEVHGLGDARPSRHVGQRTPHVVRGIAENVTLHRGVDLAGRQHTTVGRGAGEVPEP